MICANSNCTAMVAAGATTSQPASAGRITMLMPDNRIKGLAQGLSIDRGLAGAIGSLTRALGQHVVTFEATGLTQGMVRATSDIHLTHDGYVQGHVVRHCFPINSPDARQPQHVDVFVIGDV